MTESPPSRRGPIIFLLVAGLLLTGAVLVALGSGLVPPGLPGEWTWDGVADASRPLPGDLMFALAGLGLYAGWAALGRRIIESLARSRRWMAWGWLATVVPMGVMVQVALMWGAPAGYGLAKWSTMWMSGSSGYFTVAREEMGDTREFLREYPEWVKGKGVLHVGTHPPGLFLAARGLLRLAESKPGLATAVDGALPRAFRKDLQTILGRLTVAERAAIAMAGAGTLLCSVAAAVPLFWLCRGAGASRGGAWSAVVLWPVVPAAVLFHPASDTLFPLLATAALALARSAGGSRARAFASGLVMGGGMLFSLVLLAVGLVAALLLGAAARESKGGWRRWTVLMGWTGAGFLAVCLGWWAATRANPFTIWWWNQANHAGFYREYPRSYLAWVLINPVELAVALGLATAAWTAYGVAARAKGAGPAVAVAAVLVLLTLSGRSLSEVARLWLPLMPALLCAAGAGMDRLGARGWALAATVGLVGAQGIGLEGIVQVVYPV